MPAKRLMVVIVPGPRDRAFYKRFLMHVAKTLNAGRTDLDSSRSKAKKEEILRRVYWPQRGHTSPLRRASVLLLKRGNAEAAVVIIPAEEEVASVAAVLLGYQAGLARPTVEALIVAEDAEDKSFQGRLEALRDSLASRLPLLQNQLGSPTGRGRYYTEYMLQKPPARLILVAQGIEEISRKLGFSLPRHAVEDYILYPRTEELRRLLEECCLLQQAIHNREGAIRSNAHKKLALLTAAMSCHGSVEELVYRGLREKDIDMLIEASDALKRILKAIDEILRS